MGKDPAFLFYPADASEDTQFMNRLERGAYFDLVKAQKKFGMFTIEHIKKILGTDFDTCWPALQISLTYENDMYFIGWVNDSLVKRKEYAESRRKNRSGKVKHTTKENGSTYVAKTEEKGESYVVDMVIENENEIVVEIETEKIQSKAADKYIIPAMLARFKEAKPKYIVQREKDFPALLKIANIISKQEGCNLGDSRVLDTWAHIAEFIKSHKLYKDFALFQVEKYFQSITSEFVSGRELPGFNSNAQSTVNTNATAASDAINILSRKYQ